MIDPELRAFMRTLRPVEIGDCPRCKGRKTLYIHPQVKDVRQCTQCWMETRGEVEVGPEPVRKVVVEQSSLSEVLVRLSAVEERLSQVEQQIAQLLKKSPGRPKRDA